jgi:hypothetical protein
MRYFFLIAAIFCFVPALPVTSGAEVRLFTGNLEVVTTSGKACGDYKGIHQISLVIGGEEGNDAVFGYVGGDTVTVGQLRGSTPGTLSLRYPYPDAERDAG